MLENGLIASQVALWVVVVLLAGVNLLLLRQIGVLYERVAPAGAFGDKQGSRQRP